MKVCVDTVVLIDVLKDEFQANQEKLYSALVANEKLIAPTVVFAELMPQFSGDTKQVSSFLKDRKIRIDPLEIDAGTLKPRGPGLGLEWDEKAVQRYVL